MVEGAIIAAAAEATLRELSLFAAAGFLIGGVDELVIDIVWAVRTLWRRAFVYSRHPRACADAFAPASRPGRVALFVPAWDESAVIGQMVATALARLGAGDFRIYVGCYPNDPPTTAAVAALAYQDSRVRLVVCSRPGPTSKADCLNHLWTALLDDETADRRQVKAILLHDAEDIVHGAEVRVLDRLIERFALVQFPVLPLADARGFNARLISGHYCDEFAEAHGKLVVVREAIGASIPSAGVGCGIARDVLGRIADDSGGRPFDAGSLTEDYELGLKVGEVGGRGAFVRLPVRVAKDGRAEGLVCVRAHFPSTVEAAVRQKSRWIAGIALAGWDRLGWRGGVAEHWMRLRDRRALLAALVLAAAHAALLLWGALALAAWLTLSPEPDPQLPAALVWINVCLAVWRIVVRMGFVAEAYGWRWALGAPVRMIVSNIIAMLAARRALWRYWRSLRGQAMTWDKTAHVFPDRLPAE